MMIKKHLQIYHWHLEDTFICLPKRYIFDNIRYCQHPFDT